LTKRLVYLVAMSAVTVHEAKTHLSRLIRRVETGEEITICRGDEPVARLVPVKSGRTRRLGLDQDVFEVPEDFDAPLPDQVLDDFER
jgi:prevent-host-death family protein